MLAAPVVAHREHMVDPLVEVELIALIDTLAGVALRGSVVEGDGMVVVYTEGTCLYHFGSHQLPARFVVVGIEIL